MKFLVTVKRVTDYEAKVKLKADKSGVETAGVNMIVNPFDEIAVEEALRQKDKTGGGEVVVVSIGTADSTAQIRSALAMGADRGILVKHDGAIDSFGVARLLQKVVEKEKPDVVFMCKQAIDDDSSQAAQLLAELCGMGQATSANTVTLEAGKATVVREADGGLETVACELPCVITADLRLNEPRYASLPGIMKAKKKPLDELTPDALGVKLESRVVIKGFEEPAQKKAGQKVADVAALVDKLKNEAKAL
ncbi:MAG: electron transfer flavoprotein subunit beta/FixA family protein [Deltaproteobacteria bacterium]|nr:electron transfer flavoprotein subunit beta/FixA family protein [Deltaproteobacteria bacterium]